MKKVAIFGCGIAGKRAYLHLRSRYRLLTFLDNDRRQHGLRVSGVPVCDPDRFDYNRVEYVFIASMYFDEILAQR